jgi:hypothetical protein
VDVQGEPPAFAARGVGGEAVEQPEVLDDRRALVDNVVEKLQVIQGRPPPGTDRQILRGDG